MDATIDQETEAALESAMFLPQPSRGPSLEPVLGPGFVGIRGTF